MPFLTADAVNTLSSLKKSFAFVTFSPDGTVLDANELFYEPLGYSLNDIVGRHHRMFVDPTYAKSKEYEQLWGSLRQGNFESGEYNDSAKVATRFGCRHPIRPCAIVAVVS
jgi:methyl-accepting chemotaxis protein